MCAFAIDSLTDSDTVVIRDGSTPSAPIVQSLSGSQGLGRTVIASGPNLYVTFTSGTNGHGTGVLGSVSASTSTLDTCGVSTRITNIASISMGPYAPSQSCSWLVVFANPSLAPSQCQVTFRDVNLRASDSIVIHDGLVSDPVLGTLSSASTVPVTFTSTGTSMYIAFTSSASTTGRGNGFYATVTRTCSNGRFCFQKSPCSVFHDSSFESGSIGMSERVAVLSNTAVLAALTVPPKSSTSSQLRAVVGGVVGGYVGATAVVGLVVTAVLRRRRRRTEMDLALKSAKKTTGWAREVCC